MESKGGISDVRLERYGPLRKGTDETERGLGRGFGKVSGVPGAPCGGRYGGFPSPPYDSQRGDLVLSLTQTSRTVTVMGHVADGVSGAFSTHFRLPKRSDESSRRTPTSNG